MNLKTIIGLVVSGFLVPIMAKRGLPALTPDQQAELVGAGVAAVGIAVHATSPTKILAWLRGALAKSPQPSTITSVSPEVVQAIAVATVREFRKPLQEKAT